MLVQRLAQASGHLPSESEALSWPLLCGDPQTRLFSHCAIFVSNRCDICIPFLGLLPGPPLTGLSVNPCAQVPPDLKGKKLFFLLKADIVLLFL